MKLLLIYISADICQVKVLPAFVMDLQHILSDLQPCLWWIFILHVWVSSVGNVIDFLYIVASVYLDNKHFMLFLGHAGNTWTISGVPFDGKFALILVFPWLLLFVLHLSLCLPHGSLCVFQCGFHLWSYQIGKFFILKSSPRIQLVFLKFQLEYIECYVYSYH